MATPTQRPALEADLDTALRCLRAVFGAPQVTGTWAQPIGRPDPDLGAAQVGAWQATLLEETPCASPCT
jgi:hypothetical protein